jgi:excisionase family DNA binding protein
MLNHNGNQQLKEMSLQRTKPCREKEKSAMPRTKKKSEPDLPQETGLLAENGALNEVFTLSEAAAYLRLAESEVLRLVQEQYLPARKVGSEWRFLKTAIQDWLRSGTAPKSNKEAWMELAGVWKDDPKLAEMLDEIGKQRGRAMGGNGS